VRFAEGVFYDCVAVALTGRARADDVAGQASVVDGDSLESHGIRVGLFGIDAPEHDQLCRDRRGDRYRCGQVATNALTAAVL
jgi:endonuclease YncB( thermonuclease family)